MIQLKIKLILLLLSIGVFSHAQIEHYNYKRALIGISDQWHQLVLPNDLFEKTNREISDIRIFGIRAGNDTIEAPFFLQKTEDKTSKKERSFQIINTVYNNQGHFFTLALSENVSVNQIVLKFRQTNFDWKLKLEGSQNQKEWRTIVEDYRILSIQNDATQYQFSTINFPSAHYRFFRVFVNSKKEADLIRATLSLNETEAGNYQDYTTKSFVIKEDKKRHQTVIDIDLGIRVPVSFLSIDIENDFDYYRPIRIEFLVDSFETEKGWQYNYQLLKTATLSSIEDKEFEFSSTSLQKIKIIITNHNNQPLVINTVKAKGPVYKILARFTEEADYFLVYGKKNDQIPNYDISHFSNHTRNDLKPIKLGVEQKIEKTVLPQQAPLFENKAWLWGIMGVIMLLLGWFSVKMIKNS